MPTVSAAVTSLLIAAAIVGNVVLLPAAWGAAVLRIAERRFARRVEAASLTGPGTLGAGLFLHVAAAGSCLAAASLPQFLPRGWKSGVMAWALLAAVFAATHGATTVAAWLTLRRGTEPARGWVTAAGAAAIFLVGLTAGAAAAGTVIDRMIDDPLWNF